MAGYDLVIRGGTIVDGSGAEPFEGDVAVTGGRIAAIGPKLAAGREEIDAGGRIVTPGFVDIHTHYDGHVTWESRLQPSCHHGITTVVTGNCGVGFAPCRPRDHDDLVRMMAGVEDIPELVMAQGLPWNWESFAEYLDAVAARPHDMDIAAQLPHSALRLYAMGQRALDDEPATPADVELMARLTEEAMQAGAIGFATSRGIHQRSTDGHSIPSVQADEAEFHGIGAALRRSGGRVFQLLSDFRFGIDEEIALMRRIVERSGCPLSFTLHQRRSAPEAWRHVLDLLAQANAEGLPIRGQVIGRPSGVLLGFELSLNPFTSCPSYAAIAAMPLERRLAALRDPEVRARLIAEEPVRSNLPGMFDTVSLTRTWAHMFALGNPPDYEPDPETSLAARAAKTGVDPAELAYDLMMEDDGRSILFLAAQDYEYGDLEVCRHLMEDPNTILGLGDAGAHCGIVCDASYSTWMLSHWTRDRKRGPKLPLAEAIRMLTSETAEAVGLRDRGRIAAGYKADLNIIDYDRLGLERPYPAYTLPGGGKRIIQGARGFDATIVAGQVTYRDGVPTEALPGTLVRGPQAAPQG
jgi:N-acyl-D-aspartate/D-glutamate deacylase